MTGPIRLEDLQDIDKLPININDLADPTQQKAPLPKPGGGASSIRDSKEVVPPPSIPTPQKKRGIFSNLGTGIVSGAAKATAPITDLLDKAQHFLEPGDTSYETASKFLTKEGVKFSPDKGSTAGKVGEFVGSLVPGAIVQSATAGMVNPAVGPIASKVLGPTAAKIAGYLASNSAIQKAISVGITTVPQELISGSIAAAITAPESFSNSTNTLRTLALSSLGSVFNAAGAYRSAIKAAKTPAELANIRQQVEEVLAPNPSADLPSSLDVASARPLGETPAPVPTAHDIAMKRSRDILLDNIENRSVELEKKGPRMFNSEATVLEAGSPLDELQRAHLEGMGQRLKEGKLALLEQSGKGIRTLDQASVLGQQVDPKMYLTHDELRGYLDTLKGWKAFRTDKNGIVREATINKVQRKLEEASASGRQFLDPDEIQSIIEPLERITDKIANGFEIPPKPGLRSTSGANASRIEAGDISARPDASPMMAAREGVDPTALRWVTGSDEPNIVQTSVPSTSPPRVRAAAAAKIEDLRTRTGISYEDKSTSWWDRIKAAGTGYKQNFLDRAEPKLANGEYLSQQSPETRDMFHALSGVNQYSEQFLNQQLSRMERAADGTIKSVPVEGRTLKQITDDLSPEEFKDLDALLKARTTLDAKPSYKSGMSREDAQQWVNLASPKLMQASEDFRKIADLMVDDGVFFGYFPARAEELKQYFYAPNSRVFNKTLKASPYKTRVGSERDSSSPLATMYDNVHQMFQVHRKNQAYANLIGAFEKNPAAYEGLIQEWSKGARDDLLDAVDGYKASGDISTEAAEALAHLSGGLDRSNGAISVFRDGKVRYYKVDGSVKKMIDAFNPLEFGLMQATMGAISRPLRVGTSVALDLSGVGPISDTFRTTMAVPGFNPFVDPIRGAWHVATQSPEYRARIGALGAFQGRLETGATQLFKSDKASAIDKIGRTISSPLEMLQKYIKPLSDANRMGEYLVRTEKLGESQFRAAMGARRTLGDFNQVGANMRTWALITEFGNVGIQTAAKDLQFIKEAATDPRKLTRAMAVGVGGITTPTIAFWLEAQKDPELNHYRKSDQGYRYWWTRDPFTHEIVKFAKPGWNMGQIFGSSIETMLDGMDKDSARRLANGFLGQAGVNMVPVQAQTAIGLMTNQRNPLALTESPISITPKGQQGLPADLMGGQNTSNLASGLGNVGINPYKTDYLLDRVGGTFFSSIIKDISGKKGGLSGADIPGYGRFFLRDGASTEGSDHFYRDLQKAQDINKTLEKYGMEGKIDKVKQLIQDNKMILGRKQDLEKTASDLSQLQRMVGLVSNDSKISDEGKKERLGQLHDYMNTIFAQYADMRAKIEGREDVGALGKVVKKAVGMK